MAQCRVSCHQYVLSARALVFPEFLRRFPHLYRFVEITRSLKINLFSLLNRTALTSVAVERQADKKQTCAIRSYNSFQLPCSSFLTPTCASKQDDYNGAWLRRNVFQLYDHLAIREGFRHRQFDHMDARELDAELPVFRLLRPGDISGTTAYEGEAEIRLARSVDRMESGVGNVQLVGMH